MSWTSFSLNLSGLSEVSQIIAKVIGAGNITQKSGTVYDPTCGSGSLLIKVANETPNGITLIFSSLI